MGGTSRPGMAVPGLAVPGLPVSTVSPPVVVAQWANSRAIADGTGTPLPPSMPLETAVANSGDLGNGLIAFVSWVLPAGYLGCDMAVSDDARNVWQPVGAPSCSSSAAGITRSAIWACPSAFAAGHVWMSPCGLPGPVYPAVMGITITEFSGLSPYLGTPGAFTAFAPGALSLSCDPGAAGGTALFLSLATSDGSTFPVGPGAGWNVLAQVSDSGGGGGGPSYQLETTPAFMVGTSATASWTVPAAANLSAASAWILLSNPAPDQPSADWPAMSLRTGLGAGALTPPGQIEWTDITQRWLTDGDTTATQGKQYYLDSLEAAEIEATIDDNDGAFTAQNASSPYYPQVTADIPLRLIAWWQQRAYGVLAGWAESIPVSWDETWYGLAKFTLSDAWSLLQNQLSAVLREEMAWDPTLYALWPCSDPAGSASAQNIAAGNPNALQVVQSKNGVVPSIATQAFGSASGGLPGDQSATFWEQAGLTSGSEGYGWCLLCADQGFPLLTGTGVTITGWFNPTGGMTQVENAPQTLILFRLSNAASGPAFQVSLESPVGANPGAIRVTKWNVATGTPATVTVFSGNWLQAGWFHIALELTSTAWSLFINGSVQGAGAASLPSSFSWIEFMGSADRQYTGSMLNGACGYLGIYSVPLTADRIQSIYLAGTPNPAVTAGGTAAARNNAQFGQESSAPRIDRLLNYGGWLGPRSISQSGDTQLAAITDIQGSSAVIAPSGQVTVSAGGQQASEAAGNVVFSDGGFIFTSGNGELCYVTRGDLYVTASRFTLGEISPEIPYEPDAELTVDKQLLHNGAELTPSVSVSGAPVIASNPASIGAHGEYVYNATAYLDDIAQVTDLANWIVNTRGTVGLRAGAVTVDAIANADAWPLVLSLQPATPVTIWRRPQEATYSVEIFPIAVQVEKVLNWGRPGSQGKAQAKITTDVFAEGTVMIIGDPVRGQATGSNILGW